MYPELFLLGGLLETLSDKQCDALRKQTGTFDAEFNMTSRFR